MFQQIVEDFFTNHTVMELLHTVEQAAIILQLHPDTIRLWLRSGRLRGRKLGRVWRIPDNELRHLGSSCDSNISSHAAHHAPSREGAHLSAEEPNTR